MCYDDNAFYFGVRAEEPDMKAVTDLLAKPTRRVWDTDAAEFFVDLNHDRKTYYHFAANANGLQYQARHTTKDIFDGAHDSWHCEWRAAGKTDKGGWIVETAIPYTCFDLRPWVKVGRALGVNVCRQDPRNKVYTSWSFSDGGFHIPEAFGEGKGLDVDLLPYRFELVRLDHYRGIASATVKNNTGADQKVTISLIAESPDGNLDRADIPTQIEVGREADVSVPLRLHRDGIHRVFVKVSDEEGSERFLSQPIEVRIAGTDMLNLVGTEFDFYTRETKARVRGFIGAGEERCKDLRLGCWLEREGKAVGQRSHISPNPGINEWDVGKIIQYGPGDRYYGS